MGNCHSPPRPPLWINPAAAPPTLNNGLMAQHARRWEGITGLPPLASTRTLAADGWSRGALARVRSSEKFTRLARGFYADSNWVTALTPRSKHALDCFVVGASLRSPYVLSRESAAVFHGLPLGRAPTRVHIIRPARKSGRVNGTVTHAGKGAEIAEAVTVGGLPATNLVTTVVDCLCAARFGDALILADHALRLAAAHCLSPAPCARTDLEGFGESIMLPGQGQVSTTPSGASIGGTGSGERFVRTAFDAAVPIDVYRADLDMEAAERMRGVLGDELAKRPARHGSPIARAAIAEADPRAESPLESRGRALFLKAGLSMELQYSVEGASGRVYYADGAFPEERVLVEFDGRAKYGRWAEATSQALVNERDREKDLTNAGWGLVRFTWDQVTGRPDEVLRILRSALRRGKK